RERALTAALASLPGRAFPSIHLSGMEVLAADESAVPELLGLLPKARLSGRDYPLVLEGHRGYHSPLAARVAEAALERLGHVRFRAPRCHLIDGRGALHSPWSADPRELASYTLDRQVREPFDFHAALRVGLRELAPDAVVVFGPGEMGGAVGRAIALERFFGVRDRESFLARQRETPFLHALGRADQRERLLS
ncbi:ACP S-malonyltransferase, partial [bacterium]|nr:ACP S-malonyltransferase [bacterium]